jgi:hypothetical protein
LARRLKQNLSRYKRKLREHQLRALWARQAYECLQPIDHDTQDVSAVSFYNTRRQERPTRRSKRELQSSQSSREDPRDEEEENSTNPFDEGENLDVLHSDAIEANKILYDDVRNAEHPHSTGNRYSNNTQKWAFEILMTCGIKALTMVKDVIRIPSRKSLATKPPDVYARSDLTDIGLVLERVRAWRNGLEGLPNQACPRCILACDALACKLAVEVTPDGLSGLDAQDFEMDADLLERLTSSRKGFQEFIEEHCDHVLTAAFVFQIQPLNPGLQPFLIFAQPAKDGKARGDKTALLTTLSEICG